jgi:hypothetical protein
MTVEAEYNAMELSSSDLSIITNRNKDMQNWKA